MICTFFGNRDTPSSVLPTLRKTLLQLIECQHVDTFYVGNHGSFDRLVKAELKTLKLSHPSIRYGVALAYLPERQTEHEGNDFSDTVYFDELATVPKRFAIDRLNRYLVEISDIVVTYIYRPGNAATYRDYAKKQGKTVIDLYHKP